MTSGSPRRMALGGALFMLAVLVDHMDGEFARLTGLTSRFGHYYDHVAAGLGYVSLFVGLGIGLRSDRSARGRPWPAGLRRGPSPPPS
jgi:phosphatidylglycerophosphate synthase